MSSVRSSFTETVRFLLPAIILACGVFTFAAVTSQRRDPEPVERPETVPLVETVPVEQHDSGLDVQSDGVVVPHREIHLSAEVSGRVTMKADECRAGRYVRKGELLIEIDPRKYQLEMELITQEVNKAASSLQELEVDIANTQTLVGLAEEETALRKRELTRIESLHQQNAASDSAVDDARRMELASRNALAQLQNQVRKLEASRTRLTSARDLEEAKLQQARLDVEKSQVRSPIDGVIVSEDVEEDCFVQPGVSLCVIEDTSAVEIRCSLRVDELEWIWRQAASPSSRLSEGGPRQDYQLPETPVTVSYRTGKREYQWTGVLWRYEGIGLDEKTRTVPCRVLVQHPRQVTSTGADDSAWGGPRALVRGMFVKLEIHTQPGVKLLTVPERAVQPGNMVYVIRDGKLEIIKLENASLSHGEVLVPENLTGIRFGDDVVVTPLPTAIEGMAVRTASTQIAVSQDVPQ